MSIQNFVSRGAAFSWSAYSVWTISACAAERIGYAPRYRSSFGVGIKRFQMTRLETRTKESIHVCEYVLERACA